jgi:hypothetical protein
MSGEGCLNMEWDNGTGNDTSGCDGRSGNRMSDDGDAVISATRVAGIGSE